jgi:hypothetical protein
MRTSKASNNNENECRGENQGIAIVIKPSEI